MKVPDFLKNHSWLEGPSFLWRFEIGQKITCEMSKGKPTLPPGLFEPSDMYVKPSLIHFLYVLEAMGSGVPAIAARETEVEPKEKEFIGWRCGCHHGFFSSKSHTIERPVTELCLVHGV